MTRPGDATPPAGVQRPAWRLLAVLLGLLAGAGLAEVALRIGDRVGWAEFWNDARTARASSIWMQSDNPDLTYQHRPDYWRDGTRYTDRHGLLRPDDATLESPPGTYRITAIGDSVGAALTLPYADRVFSQLERTLTVPDTPAVEVLNFCVNGYGTQQEAALVEAVAHRFETNLLILQYCVNDFYPTEYPTRWFMEQSPSYLVSLVARALDGKLIPGYPPASYWERLYRTDENGWGGVYEGFETIVASAQSAGIPALLVIFPAISHGGWFEGEAANRHARVAALGRRTGFTVLDLLPVYARYPVEQLRSDPWDTYHPNAEGHRVAAEAIGLVLKARGLWPPADGPPDR